jgi:flagellar biosynthesis protein FlhB
MAGEKTEQPTPRRRLKAREQGQVPRSRELSNAMATLAAVFVLAWQIDKTAASWLQYARQALALAVTTDVRLETELLPRTLWFALRWSVVPMGAAWLTATVVSLAQGGLVFAPEALAFNPSRLSPAAKLKQMFSVTGLSSLLKSLLPAGFILYLSVQILLRDWGVLPYGMRWNPRQFTSFLLGRVFEICWKGMLVMLIWSALDYLLVRQKHESGLKMSREELREEMKQTEGNPQIKMRIRRLQRQVRRRKMLDDVRRASVVVVNPTHFAVALQYGPELAAPVVVAKGRNLLAEQIKQTARWHGIAIMENPPLAHALYRTVAIGQPIPAKLYAAVAEILAFVYRMQAQAMQAKERGHGR